MTRVRDPDTEALFATAESTATLLVETSFHDPEIGEASFVSRFHDAEHWLTWA